MEMKKEYIFLVMLVAGLIFIAFGLGYPIVATVTTQSGIEAAAQFRNYGGGLVFWSVLLYFFVM